MLDLKPFRMISGRVGQHGQKAIGRVIGCQVPVTVHQDTDRRLIGQTWVQVPAFSTRVSGDYGMYKIVGRSLLHGRGIQQRHVPQVWQKCPKNLKYPMVRHLPDAAPSTMISPPAGCP